MTLTHAVAAVAISVAAVTLSESAFAGNPLRPGERSAVDFTKYLPRLEEVPWLDARTSPQRQGHVCLPEAGTVSALLLSSSPARTWPESFAATASGPVGM